MPLRYLVGPVSPTRAREWTAHRQEGRCLCFNAEGTTDLRLAHTDRWDDVLARLPESWRPDFIVLDLNYTTIPAWLWQAPVPLVALAADPQLQWHFFRRFLPLCQLVLTDQAGVDAMHRQGISHAVAANLFGLQGIFQDCLGNPDAPAPLSPLGRGVGDEGSSPLSERERAVEGEGSSAPPPRSGEGAGGRGDLRTIDILFVGNMHSAVQRERLSFLGRLARLGGRFRVHIAQGVHGEEYRQLLLRSRIVFNRSIRGEWNLRVGEACSCGALLFVEAENLEMPAIWTHGEECVFYTKTNLESLLIHYLTHEEERQRIAEQGRRKMAAFTFTALWQAAMAQIEEHFPDVLSRHAARPTLAAADALLARTWQALCAADAGDPLLPADLDVHLALSPDADLLNARGVVQTLHARDDRGRIPVERLRPIGTSFQQSARGPTGNRVAALNLIETLIGLKEKKLAVDGARNLLTLLLDGRLSALDLEQPHIPPGYGFFRVEWEGAAWRHAGCREDETREKLTLLRWRLHTLLGDLTGELHSFHEAVIARPDLPTSRAALGCALGKANQPAEAVAHLQFAVQANPFDRAAARALYQALRDVGNHEQADALARERLQLHLSAPTVAPAEDWFMQRKPQPATPSAKEERPVGWVESSRPTRSITSSGGSRRLDPPYVQTAPLAPWERGLGGEGSSSRPKASLCVIAKNEEANIGPCLQSVAGLFNDIVVVDTGSTDRTKEIALQHGARVFDFPWVDSFSAARNETLRHAQGEWIFWLDADDRVDEPNREKLCQLLAHLPEENICFSLKCRCLPDPKTDAATTVDHIRLFRNDPRIRWRYRIHEQILGAVRAAGGRVEFVDIVVQHTGYTDAALRQRKLQRDLRLLEMEYREQPHDLFTLFNLGANYAEMRRYDEALPLLRESLERSHPTDSIVRKLYALIANCHLKNGRADEALRLCAEGQAVCPDDQELLFLEGIVRTEQEDYHGAKAVLLRLLGTHAGQHFASVMDGLRGHKGRHQLACVCSRLGETSEAELLWKVVLRDRPGFLPARVGLGQLYLANSRWEELEEVIAELEKIAQGEVDAVLLRGKAHLARQEFASARALLEETLEKRPGCMPVLMLLSWVLLQEDRDHRAAEKVLDESLTREPGNAQARQNLEVLRRRMAS